jgi:hypothetical protein
MTEFTCITVSRFQKALPSSNPAGLSRKSDILQFVQSFKDLLTDVSHKDFFHFSMTNVSFKGLKTAQIIMCLGRDDQIVSFRLLFLSSLFHYLSDCPQWQ